MSEDLERRKRPTIHDVARQAGVAVGTVSRYLNGQDVRAGKRAEIERAVEALGFRRSALAAAMKGERTGLVGFMAPDFDEYHSALLNHLAQILRQSGQKLLTYSHATDGSLLRQSLDFLVEQRVDALVMAGLPNSQGILSAFHDEGIPVVVYNNDVRGERLDRVFVDNVKASSRAVGHLVDVGHRKIALVTGDPKDSTGVERRLGYEEALRRHDIPIDPAYVFVGDWKTEAGYNALQGFMALSDPPTAIFSSNYRMTTGVLEWLREHGLRTPQDIAIVSFDDVDLFRLYDDGITAVAQPLPLIAEAIAGYVATRLGDGEVPDIRSRTIECNIILRGSTRRPLPASPAERFGHDRY
ncbi:LacI family DNA-binding transcriptional regulator [Aureimonas pseudogalii]|uniref:LacI family transcriptional regulator n=1 Tax=Aureimonas pseudogalii TaxID=1744844 RepID=A0A7W6MME2_9HYPH|nr:LacI family DNA-binding transcriptional regulator [Aureimonas pseudogalii]MBB4000694.1 LacI family transcriptional regulator [Aureimonas pseudogalii]